jgi:hypothetical protein
MAVPYKICIDCADPHRLAAFWADAMGYVVEDYSTFIRSLLDAGRVTEEHVTTVDGHLAWRHAAGSGTRTARSTTSPGSARRGGCCSRSCPRPRR